MPDRSGSASHSFDGVNVGARLRNKLIEKLTGPAGTPETAAVSGSRSHSLSSSRKNSLSSDQNANHMVQMRSLSRSNQPNPSTAAAADRNTFFVHNPLAAQDHPRVGSISTPPDESYVVSTSYCKDIDEENLRALNTRIRRLSTNAAPQSLEPDIL